MELVVKCVKRADAGGERVVGVYGAIQLSLAKSSERCFAQGQQSRTVRKVERQRIAIQIQLSLRRDNNQPEAEQTHTP